MLMMDRDSAGVNYMESEFQLHDLAIGRSGLVAI